MLRRSARNPATVRQLLTHTSGFGYEFFDERLARYVKSVVCVNRSVHVHCARDITGEAIRELYGQDVRIVQHGHHHRLGSLLWPGKVRPGEEGRHVRHAGGGVVSLAQAFPGPLQRCMQRLDRIDRSIDCLRWSHLNTSFGVLSG